MLTDTSGTERFTIRLCANDGAPPDTTAAYLDIVKMFLESIRLGLLAPTRLLGDAQYIQDKACAITTVTLAGHSLQIFNILHGMTEFYRGQGAPLLPIAISNAQGPVPLTPLPLHAVPAELPFTLTTKVPELGRPLVVLVDFAGPVSPDTCQAVLGAFGVWSALLCGGFPPAGAAPGESAIGPYGVRFLHPALLEFATESWYAAPEGLTPLLRFLQGLHATQPVKAVEIQ